MDIFEFLKFLDKEAYPFQLRYDVSLREIEVVVEAFSKKEVYTFDEDGVSSFYELIERNYEEDDTELMKARILDLKDRSARAWIDAAADLNIKFIHPYHLIGIDGYEYEFAGLLPDFGGKKGMLIPDRKTTEDALLMAELVGGYSMTYLNFTYYNEYDRDIFIEALSAWGWNKKNDPPEWLL